MTHIAFTSAARFEPAQIVAALNSGYEDYLVPLSFTVPLLERMLRSEHIDLGASYVAMDRAGNPIGIMLIARRSGISRVAALGIAKLHRGSGIGRRALERAIADARARGDRKMRLEVIAANTAAIRLYESAGFSERRRLVGYELDCTAVDKLHPDWTTCTPDVALNLIVPQLASDLPWQVAAETMTSIAPQLQGFINRAGTAAALFTYSEGRGRLSSLGVAPAARGKGLATEMIAALTSAFPGSWQVPAIVPDRLIERIMLRAGWRKSALSQFEMEWFPVADRQLIRDARVDLAGQ